MSEPIPPPAPRRDTAHRVVLALAILVHVGIVASILTQARPVIWPLHNDTIHRPGPGADFYALYHAANMRVRGWSPYDPRPDGVTPFYFPFRYLPVVADAGRIALVLPPAAAHRVWIVVLEALLAWLAVLLWRRVEGTGMRVFAVCALLLSSPYFLELYIGQFTFAAVGLLLVALWLPYGVVPYTLTSLLKVFPLVTAPALVRHRRFLPHVIVAALACAGFSIPYFTARPREFEMFLNINLLTPGALDSGNYGNIYMLWRIARDLGIEPILEHWRLVSVGLRAVVLAATALVVLRSRNDDAVLGASALLLAHFVTFGHEWEHHACATVLIGLALLTVRAFPRRQLVWTAAAVAVLVLPTPYALFDHAKDPAVWDPAVDWPAWQRYAVLLPKTLPALFLYGIAMARLAGGGPPPVPRTPGIG